MEEPGPQALVPVAKTESQQRIIDLERTNQESKEKLEKLNKKLENLTNNQASLEDQASKDNKSKSPQEKIMGVFDETIHQEVVKTIELFDLYVDIQESLGNNSPTKQPKAATPKLLEKRGPNDL